MQLTKIPNEILTMIFEYLNPCDAAFTRESCKLFAELIPPQLVVINRYYDGITLLKKRMYMLRRKWESEKGRRLTKTEKRHIRDTINRRLNRARRITFPNRSGIIKTDERGKNGLIFKHFSSYFGCQGHYVDTLYCGGQCLDCGWAGCICFNEHCCCNEYEIHDNFNEELLK